MHKYITFLPDVSQEQKEEVLNFVKSWSDSSSFIEVSTSGSTGQPKILRIEKSRMRASALATGQYFGFTSDSVLVLALSVNYIAGKMMVIRALEHQSTLIVAPTSSTPLAHLNQKADFIALVPMQAQKLISSKEGRAKYEQIKQVLLGGAPVSSQLESDLKTLNNQTFASFGMTETISHIALRNINKNEDFYTGLKGVHFSVNEQQALKIEAPHIISTPIQTNDVVELMNDKQFKWLGRLDFVINSGGVKLHPELLEKKISPLLHPYRFYLSARADETLGQKLILKIESTSEKWDINKLKNKLKSVLGKYEMPKEIEFIATFEETATGKIKRL